MEVKIQHEHGGDHSQATVLLQVCFSGHGKHLGLDVLWRVCCRADGAFLEEIKSAQLNFTYAHSGVSTGASLPAAWAVRRNPLP